MSISEQQEIQLIQEVYKLTERIEGATEDKGEPVVGYVISDVPQFVGDFLIAYKKIVSVE